MSTPAHLRKFLKNEFITLFDDINNLSVFEQDLPKRKYESDEKTLFPFILIEVDGGVVPLTPENKNTCTVNIVIRVDQDEQNQPEALEVLSKIILHLKSNPILGGKYTLSDSINWNIGKDETEPYEYGIIDGLTFNLPYIEQIQSEYN